MKTGIYEISKERYHNDPCIQPSLSRSFVTEMLAKTPAHAWVKHRRLNPHYEREESTSFDLGKAVEDIYFSDSSNIDVIQANDWRTKAAKEMREISRSMGRTALLADQYHEVINCVDSIKRNLPVLVGQRELSYIWQENGVWCRSRPDFTANDGWIYDFKTTGLEPDAWLNSSFEHGYDIQSYMGLHGAAMNGRKYLGFRFIIAEIKAPYCIYFAEYTPEMLTQAKEKFYIAVRIFGKCLKENNWPGYSKDSKLIASTYKSNQLYARALELEERMKNV